MATMPDSHLHLLCLSLFLLCCISPASFLAISFDFTYPNVGRAYCSPHAIQAFAHFKNEFDTRHCNHNDDSNGIWCDKATGEVTKLILSNCLSGTLMPNSSLFRFHQLRYLSLSENNFTSSSVLPSEFGNLNKLEVLYLHDDGFVGQVPSSFNNLSRLAYLGLSNNDLMGSLGFVGNLSKLTFLDLSYNHFSGTLNPNSSLFELHHLRYLDLGYNNFSSSFPSKFGNLKNLEILGLSMNGFFGQVSPTISNLTRLSQLYLHENKLTGSFFPLVQNLTEISILAISNNQFSGTIPSSLFTKPFLYKLKLSGNNFEGSIEVPNSSTISRIETLCLGGNHFDGKIIEPISKLINLKHVQLSFLNISYPIDLNLLSSLESLMELDLSGNYISPSSLSSKSFLPLTLELLALKQCGINEFPNILRSFMKLEDLDISKNTIKGKIPEWLWSLPGLRFVDIGDNYAKGFEGSAEVFVNSSVLYVNLESNKFEGELPNLPLSIQFFSVRGNNFTGEIPHSICKRSSLTNLDLSYNNFTGHIPQCLRNLEVLWLRNNNLEGNIPDVLCVVATLRSLDVGFNQLSGKLSRSLVNCSSLKFLSVRNNRIEDTFPFWLKALPNLQVLTLRSNKFYGPISPPHHQGPLGFPELRIFEISDNKFTGSLPPNYFVNWKATLRTIGNYEGLYMDFMEKSYDKGEFGYTDAMDLQYKGLTMNGTKVLTSYAAIDFSGNRLEGQIPESIGLLEALIALDLSNNAFTGYIPLSMANLKELESLDLSRNKLSGTIPNGLGSLSFLEYINVSHNQLKGEIPQGPQITGQSKSSFEENAGLCGLPLEGSCFGTSAPQMQHHKQEDGNVEEEEEQVLNWRAVAIGYGSGVLFGLVVAQVIASYKPEWLATIICLNKRRNR